MKICTHCSVFRFFSLSWSWKTMIFWVFLEKFENHNSGSELGGGGGGSDSKGATTREITVLCALVMTNTRAFCCWSFRATASTFGVKMAVLWNTCNFSACFDAFWALLMLLGRYWWLFILFSRLNLLKNHFPLICYSSATKEMASKSPFTSLFWHLVALMQIKRDFGITSEGKGKDGTFGWRSGFYQNLKFRHHVLRGI